MIYSKHGAEVIKERLVSKSQRYSRKVFISLFKFVLAGFVFLVVVAAGAGFGMMKGILDNAPDINGISIKPKGFKSTIYYEDGTVSKSISKVNSDRVYVYYDDIPESVRNAFVAIEDERYWQHNGIDIRGIMRAAIRGITTRNFDQGASTITQQLIKNAVFNVGMDETSFLEKFERKIWEQSLAIELEKKYTKEQILEYYLNTIYLGSGVNGVEAASETYFGKKVSELTVSEASVIAGITQNPYAYDPNYNPEDNAKRRKLVLKKMLELDYIDQAEYDACLADNVYDRIKEAQNIRKEAEHWNTYFEDEILRELAAEFEEMYGMTEDEAYDEAYTGGYKIISTQDPAVQKICEETVRDPDYYPDDSTVALDYDLTLVNSVGERFYYGKGSFISYYSELTGDPTYNNIYSSPDTAREAAERYKEAMIEKTGYKFDSENFEVTPQPTATMVIIDQHTGYVVAIANGRSEKKGNLTGNLATQGVRQPGSTFKVIASFLPYLDTGGNLAFTQKDEPYEFADGSGIVNNWYGGYHGSGSIRDGIRDSMNVIAVKTITLVTPEVAFDYCEKLGFTTLIRENENGATDITQSLALGGLTYGVTNLEITAAYATIANGGIYRKPVFYSKVYDHDGNLIIDHSNDDETRARRVIKPTTAWMLIDCMRDVISWEGTGDAAIPRNDFDRAGKTGTTSSTYDLWFCGMSPYYTASVWYGYETQTRLGDRTDHKRIWRDVMDKICEHQHWDPDRLIMEQPEGLTQVTVCKLSGDLPSGGCPTNTDWGAVDSLPSNYCEGHETIRVCMETHKIATDMCPDAKEYAVTTDRKTGKKTIHDADFEYDESIFSSSCDKHKSKEELGLDEEGRPVIKTSATEGGEISGTTSVPMNSSVTVFIKPHDGYIIKDVTVNGQSVGPVTQWAINNVDRGQTINAVFEKINQDPQPQPQPQPQPEPDPQPNDQQQTPPDNPGDGGDDSGDSGDDSGDSGDSGESGE